MKLDDLCGAVDERGFPTGNAPEHPDRESVVALRAAVVGAVGDDEFLVDCMARELDLVERGGPRRGLVPFFTLPAYGIGFAFGYWPPGGSAGAHEHTAWTITAVCRNELAVQTYDRDESYRRQELIPKNRFDAPAGRVGFIYEPCIHNPCNPTDRWSLSLHVTSPRDGQRPADQDRCLPVLDTFRARLKVDDDDPYVRVQASRHQQILLREIARFLAGTRISVSESLLERCVGLGSATTRRFIGGLGVQLAQTSPGSAATLRVAHDGLNLSCRDVGDCVALGIETAEGWVEQLRMARLAREAVAFCAGTREFAIGEIPGRLTAEERYAIAEALEESGMFRMATC